METKKLRLNSSRYFSTELWRLCQLQDEWCLFFIRVVSNRSPKGLLSCSTPSSLLSTVDNNYCLTSTHASHISDKIWQFAFLLYLLLDDLEFTRQAQNIPALSSDVQISFSHRYYIGTGFEVFVPILWFSFILPRSALHSLIDCTLMFYHHSLFLSHQACALFCLLDLACHNTISIISIYDVTWRFDGNR